MSRPANPARSAVEVLRSSLERAKKIRDRAVLEVQELEAAVAALEKSIPKKP